MIDIKLLRENPDKVLKAAKDKGVKVDIDRILELDKKNREAIITAQKLLEERNKIAHDPEVIKRALDFKDSKITPDILKLAIKLKKEIKDQEQKQADLKKELDSLLLTLPNLPKPDVKVGKDESENVEVRKWGKPTKFNFTPKDHLGIGQALDIIDVERASKVSGSSFAYLKGDAVLLEFALIQFGMETLTNEGFTPIVPPVMIRPEITEGLGYWQAGGHGDYYLVFDPSCRECRIDLGSESIVKAIGEKKFEDELSKVGILADRIEDYKKVNVIMNPKYVPEVKNCLNCGARLSSEFLYLVGTAEHSIVPMHKDELLNVKDLPKRYVGFSTAFRREAGSYGKDTKGILRVHQFDKVEMVSFVMQGEDDREHEYLLSLEEKLFQALGIPYQVVKMCTGDLGFPAARKYDIEAWMPGQNKYREVTSVSTVTDFQSRRLNIKYQNGPEKKFVNILNGTGFAIGRTIIAILENYQEEDGSVRIPQVLQKYMGGLEKIERKT